MEHRQAIEKIVAIEKQVDTSGVVYKAIHLWPLIRMELWRHLLRPDLGVGLEALKIAIPAHPLQRARQAIRDGLKLWGNAHDGVLHPVDVAFFSMPIYYSDRFEVGFYHRHLDPLIEYCHATSLSTGKVELHSADESHTLPRAHPTTFLRLAPYLARQRLQLNMGFKPHIPPAAFAELNHAIHRVIGHNPITLDDLSRIIQTLEVYIRLFTATLRRQRPRAVFLTTYYHLPCMGLIYAARRLGIPTVDVQHGKQGKYHAAYNHWTAIPANSYGLLPNYFWVWGEESKTNILAGREADAHVHLPIVGGNLWLARWANGQFSYQPPHDAGDFYRRLKSAPKRILISLQPPHSHIPDIILRAMQQSDPSWLWLIRLHPRSIQDKPAIMKQLDDNGLLARAECDFATQEPLYALLRETHHHITRFSTVCYEALYFQVATTLLGPEAHDLYADYIAKGIFYYARTADELLQSIAKAETEGFATESVPYIETRPEAAEAALARILRKHHE